MGTMKATSKAVVEQAPGRETEQLGLRPYAAAPDPTVVTVGDEALDRDDRSHTPPHGEGVLPRSDPFDF
jgi:hypothetical protein